MKIEIRSLTECSVIKGGDRISLGLLDDSGERVELKVSAADACAMAMTLPRLLRSSIKEKYQDDSLRYVFPLDTWTVEAASDGSQMILTLATGNRFEVSFSTMPDTCASLGVALRDAHERHGPTHKVGVAIPAVN